MGKKRRNADFCNTQTETFFQTTNFDYFSNSARNRFTALAKITCFVFASVSNSLINSSGETLNSHKCRGLPFPLTAPWVDNTQPRKRHCFRPLETWLTDSPESFDSCLIVR